LRTSDARPLECTSCSSVRTPELSRGLSSTSVPRFWDSSSPPRSLCG